MNVLGKSASFVFTHTEKEPRQEPKQEEKGKIYPIADLPPKIYKVLSEKDIKTISSRAKCINKAEGADFSMPSSVVRANRDRPENTLGLTLKCTQKMAELSDQLLRKEITLETAYNTIEKISNEYLLHAVTDLLVPAQFIGAVNRRKLAFALRNHINSKEAGLFRVPSNNDKLKNQWQDFKNRLLTEEILKDPHLLSSLLKRMLRENTMISQKDLSSIDQKTDSNHRLLSVEFNTLKDSFIQAYSEKNLDQKDTLQVCWQVMKYAFDVAPKDPKKANALECLAKEGLADIFAACLTEEALSSQSNIETLKKQKMYLNIAKQFLYTLLEGNPPFECS